jgi:hypothetical protein
MSGGQMPWRERAIRERFERQACSQCGTPYLADGVVVVAHRGSVYVLLASCPHCEHRAFFLVSFPHRALDSVNADSAQFTTPLILRSPAQAPSERIPDEPPVTGLPPSERTITSADVEAMHHFLGEFDGDFRRLFGD